MRQGIHKLLSNNLVSIANIASLALITLTFHNKLYAFQHTLKQIYTQQHSAMLVSLKIQFNKFTVHFHCSQFTVRQQLRCLNSHDVEAHDYEILESIFQNYSPHNGFLVPEKSISCIEHFFRDKKCFNKSIEFLV